MATKHEHAATTGKRGEVTYTAGDDEPLSGAVIAALRTAVGREQPADQDADAVGIDSLTPLFETIDPDALNALFSSTYSGTSRTGTITFTHDGYEVTATSDGHVTVSSEE
ncbi:HalOD1 output domain-containing protein [Natronorubrum sulfidifaciens]|uniref:Halobacterial output domain-containing protein n=1 Tax=Natronorubrum sulfidifaciens JCM 14089 TaxID=1230460 RepID=L9VYD6_9EURY|nr:HalOD1 output domain-containing protein [Natronorubrum sulfidifaciens]ELY42022.1 hypothetical protein C495_15768 [Natronorubrum sulfidifaciens JCM 14089]